MYCEQREEEIDQHDMRNLYAFDEKMDTRKTSAFDCRSFIEKFKHFGLPEWNNSHLSNPACRPIFDEFSHNYSP